MADDLSARGWVFFFFFVLPMEQLFINSLMAEPEAQVDLENKIVKVQNGKGKFERDVYEAQTIFVSVFSGSCFSCSMSFPLPFTILFGFVIGA